MEKSKAIKPRLAIAMVCDPVTDYTAGVFVSTLRFAERLVARGHKVIFIAAKSPMNPKDNYHKDIKVYRFPSILMPKSEQSWYNAFPSPAKLKEIFKKEQINLVHLLLPTPAALISAKVARKSGLPIVSHSHAQPENLFLHIPGKFIRKALGAIYVKYLSWIYNHAKVLVYPSQFAQKLLSDSDHLPSVVISNGVDLNKFKKVDVKNFLEKFNLSPHKKRLLFVGRLHPEKSIDTLIKAMELILKQEPDVELLIVGGGHLEEKLKALTKDLALETFILFLGKVSDEDLVAAYNTCDLFVLPSLAELEGMVILEAMACGKPLLVADAKESASPLFVLGNGLLFSPEDHRDLALQALKILSNENLRKEMQDASYKRAQEYDVEESVSKLEELYYSQIDL